MPRNSYYGVMQLGLLNGGSQEHIKLVYHTDTCMAHMLLSPISSETEDFADTHMHGANIKNTVLIVIGCCDVEYSERACSTLG